MLVTGNQLKAARALAGMDQRSLADAAGVAVNTVRGMESAGCNEITSSAPTVRKVQRALETAHVEFICEGNAVGAILKMPAS